MTNRTRDRFLPFLLQHPDGATNPEWRDEITCDDPLPAIVEPRAYLARGTRITEIKQETLDDQ
jgi:hypothetical protein